MVCYYLDLTFVPSRAGSLVGTAPPLARRTACNLKVSVNVTRNSHFARRRK